MGLITESIPGQFRVAIFVKHVSLKVVFSFFKAMQLKLSDKVLSNFFILPIFSASCDSMRSHIWATQGSGNFLKLVQSKAQITGARGLGRQRLLYLLHLPHLLWQISGILFSKLLFSIGDICGENSIVLKYQGILQ